MAHMGMYLERAESPNRWDDSFQHSGTLAGNTAGGNTLTEDDMAKTHAYGCSAAFHPDHVPKNDTSDDDMGPSTKETIENFTTNSAKSSLREGRTGTPCYAFAKSASLNISSLDANKTKHDIKFIKEKCHFSYENGISENHGVESEAKSNVRSRCVRTNEVGSSMVSHRSDSFALDHIKDEQIESCGRERSSPSSGNASSATRLDGHHSHRSKNTNFLRRNKSVKFAAISRWMKYDADCIISQSLDKDESNAIIHSTLRQWRKRKLPKTNKLSSRRIEFVSSQTIQQTEVLVENSRPQLTAEESAHTSSIHINNSSDLSVHSHQSFSVKLNQAIVGKPGSSESDQHGLLAHTKLHPNKKKTNMKIALLHSPSHTQIIYHAMKYIHKDRDLLLESLLKWCGILQGAKGSLSSFFSILPPKRGTRKLLQCFHAAYYLDLLEYPPSEQNGFGIDGFWHDHNAINNPEIEALLAKHGLEDDCPLPADSNARKILWKYCLSVAGASWHAASLLMGGSADEDERDVVIHWGGGRHHSHSDKAGGFCYVNDVVLAIHRLLHSRVDGVDDGMFVGILDNQSSSSFGDKSTPRILYIDLDIHHPDGVQSAFYSTDRVFTASFHRFAPGFFPALSGSIREKGESGSAGLGYNLNVPLPAGIGDVAFIRMFRRLLFGLVKSYDPHAVVLCLGADGLKGDELITGSGRGCDNLGKFVNFECTSASSGECWNLSPEGLAECVRIAAALCAGVEGEEILSAPPKDVIDKVSFQDAEPDVMVDQLSSEKKQRSPAYKTNRKKRKLLILGGGGYTPAQTARTYLLCTAAACEGARPGMMWSELPKDIPAHDYFPRYGPSFELVSEDKKLEIFQSYYVNDSIVGEASDHQLLREGMRAIDLACLYIDHDRGKKFNQRTGLANGQVDSFSFDGTNQDEVILTEISRKRKKEGTKKSLGGRRRKKKIPGKSIP